jgi:hypothetical protein
VFVWEVVAGGMMGLLGYWVVDFLAGIGYYLGFMADWEGGLVSCLF